MKLGECKDFPHSYSIPLIVVVTKLIYFLQFLVVFHAYKKKKDWYHITGCGS